MSRDSFETNWQLRWLRTGFPVGRRYRVQAYRTLTFMEVHDPDYNIPKPVSGTTSNYTVVPDSAPAAMTAMNDQLLVPSSVKTVMFGGRSISRDDQFL